VLIITHIHRSSCCAAAAVGLPRQSTPGKQLIRTHLSMEFPIYLHVPFQPLLLPPAPSAFFVLSLTATAAMAEHVKRLRDCVMAGKKVDMDDIHVIMDGQTVPRNALTNIMMSSAYESLNRKNASFKPQLRAQMLVLAAQVINSLTSFFRVDPGKKFYTIEAVWNALKCKDYRVRE
jgi:hypothetical protein